MLYWLISFICRRWIGGKQAASPPHSPLHAAKHCGAGQRSPLSSACDKLANEERPSHFHKLINPAGTETNYNIYVISSRICLQGAHPHVSPDLSFRYTHKYNLQYFRFNQTVLLFHQHCSWFHNTHITMSITACLGLIPCSLIYDNFNSETHERLCNLKAWNSC